MAAPDLHKWLYASTCSFLVATGCPAESLRDNPSISISNLIEECFRIKPANELIHNNVIMLDAELSIIKSVGYCGCKSAVLSYYVTTRPVESRHKTKEHGVFSPLRNGTYTFVLERNNTRRENGSYTLNIQCASPD